MTGIVRVIVGSLFQLGLASKCLSQGPLVALGTLVFLGALVFLGTLVSLGALVAFGALVALGLSGRGVPRLTVVGVLFPVNIAVGVCVMIGVLLKFGVWVAASVGGRLDIIVGRGMGVAMLVGTGVGPDWTMARACVASTVVMASGVQ